MYSAAAFDRVGRWHGVKHQDALSLTPLVKGLPSCPHVETSSRPCAVPQASGGNGRKALRALRGEVRNMRFASKRKDACSHLRRM